MHGFTLTHISQHIYSAQDWREEDVDDAIEKLEVLYAQISRAASYGHQITSLGLGYNTASILKILCFFDCVGPSKKAPEGAFFDTSVSLLEQRQHALCRLVRLGQHGCRRLRHDL